MTEANIRTDKGFINPYSGKMNATETKLCIYIDSETTPILMKIPLPADCITLADFRAASSLNSSQYRYFFKRNDPELGNVKEEISIDDHKLPTFKGSVVAWVVKPGGLRGNITSHNTCESECDLAHSRTYDSCDESSSMLTTDIETSSYFGSETEQDNVSCSTFSETTSIDTSVSQIKNPHHQNSRINSGNAIYRSQRRRESSPSQSSSSTSSLSDATAVQIVTVNLMLTQNNFLGLTISGHLYDGGLSVVDIRKNSAVEQDGRIERGDILLQVNDINLEDMSTKEAVHVLEQAVAARGPLKLVVAKCYETKQERNLVSREEAVHPIDTAAWVAHTAALTMPDLQTRPSSTTSSPSFGSCLIDSDCIQLATAESGRLNPLHKDKTDMKIIVQRMTSPESGLEVKDREWLKIVIPKALLGSDLVFWLQHNVYGFKDRRDAKNYAKQLFKKGYIRDPIAGKSFSEKCYYTFANLSSM